MKSLFGHIVFNFTSQAENFATEALHYILSNSSPARDGLKRFLVTIDNRLNIDLQFVTQVHEEDGTIPDLVGFDENTDQICILESKFWAGLTDNQPVNYLKRLNPTKPSILLFLVPSKRLNTIWSELIDRCEDSGILINNEIKAESYIFSKINDYNYLAVVDWNSMLNIIETELDNASDYIIKSDLIQLRGLCHQMDSESFLPFDSHEISPMIAKKNLQIYDIIEEVLSKGHANGILRKGSPGCTKYWYLRYFVIQDYNFFLSFDNEKWYGLFNSPLWLGLYGKGWLNDKKERNKVKKALTSYNSRIFFDKNNVAAIPLKIKLGVEKHQVVESVLNQIEEIFQNLNNNYPD